MEHKGSLCLCMIAKDEEAFLKKCIESVRDIVDEIVVVDTGSADNTAKLARELGADVYPYTWEDSFALARNYAMSKAKSDWLLLLDADERLERADHEALLSFIRTTTFDGAHLRIRNYTGSYSPDQYSLHNALRLLRNNGQYRFHGAIHEQITSEHTDNISARFTTLDVTVHHFGYLDDVVKRKDKRKRNLPLLEKQLEADPDEPFTLFNLGNEHLSLKDYQKAISYYEASLEKLGDQRIAFGPHLYLRMVTCYTALGQHEKALRTIREGLAAYPRCTDLVFLRADIERKLKRFTLAIDSLEACLKMGAPPPTLELLPGCGTYRAAFALGELYLELFDYPRAAKAFLEALACKPQLYAVLYRLGNAFGHMYGEEEVKQKLFSCFANPRHTPNALVGADVLLSEGLYRQALCALNDLTETEGHEAEICYVRGKALLYLGEREEASAALKQACTEEEKKGRVLRGVPRMGAQLLFALSLVEEDSALMVEAVSCLKKHGTPHETAAAELMEQLIKGETPGDPQFTNGGEAELAFILAVFDCMLKCKAFEMLDRFLKALNYVDTKFVLLRLAHLFDENGFAALAKEYVFRSVKELDTLDAVGAGILYRNVLS